MIALAPQASPQHAPRPQPAVKARPYGTPGRHVLHAVRRGPTARSTPCRKLGRQPRGYASMARRNAHVIPLACRRNTVHHGAQPQNATAVHSPRAFAAALARRTSHPSCLTPRVLASLTAQRSALVSTVVAQQAPCRSRCARPIIHVREPYTSWCRRNGAMAPRTTTAQPVTPAPNHLATCPGPGRRDSVGKPHAACIHPCTHESSRVVVFTWRPAERPQCSLPLTPKCKAARPPR